MLAAPAEVDEATAERAFGVLEEWRMLTPEEAAELWPRLVETYPPFKTYVTRTERELPVMILEPR